MDTTIRCHTCGHRFPGMRARYVVGPVSFLVVLLLFTAMKYFDEKAKETHIRNLESGIARQYGIVDTTVHPTRQEPWFWSLFRSKPTASEVFAHNLEVSGGADALAKIKSLRATAMLSVNPLKAAVYPAYDTVTVAPPAKMVMRAKAPDKILAEVEMKLSSRETGYGTRTLRRGFDGARLGAGRERSEAALGFGAGQAVGGSGVRGRGA